MMKETARIFGYKRYFEIVPLMSLGLSKLWVRLISGSPADLVYPLVDSLKSSMQVRSDHSFPSRELKFTDFHSALTQLVPQIQEATSTRPHAFSANRQRKSQNQVRSIQRLPLPEGRDAAWVAEEYLRYLPRLLPFLIRVLRSGNFVYFRVKFFRIVLLQLRHAPERSRPDRQLFYVVGGILFRRGPWRARLEIREALGKTVCLVALHDFQPALPWYIYVSTQAQVHQWFMRKLGKHLQKFPPLTQGEAISGTRFPSHAK